MPTLSSSIHTIEEATTVLGVARIDLVMSAEIVQMLGLSRPRVDQLANTKNFPEPVAVVKAGRIWLRKDVEEWAAKTGREVQR